MDRDYWEKIALTYNEDIFDVFRNDKTGIIRSMIRQHSSPSKSVMDIGCAVGKWIPFLSAHFNNVIATDISARNIEIARENCKSFTNIEYRRADMSDSSLSIKPCDVAVCINAILTGSLPKRVEFFKSLTKCVKRGGFVILVVPSLESSMYTSIIRHRWKVDRPSRQKAYSSREKTKKIENIQQGNVDIDNVPTKHYLREELILLLEREGFVIPDIVKVEYNWKTEFVQPPRWLKAPYPWDWLCVAKKK